MVEIGCVQRYAVLYGLQLRTPSVGHARIGVMTDLFGQTIAAPRPFTDFYAVNRNTDLSTLDLNWHESDLPEKVRTKHVHRLHPYLGKFIPQLVEIFLRKFTPRLVYDPFCGSGTTLVEASVLGVESVGTDISEFNVLLSRVKTAQYDVGVLAEEAMCILGQLEPAESEGRLFESPAQNAGAMGLDRNDYLSSWFAPPALCELLQYKELASSSAYPDLFNVILSRSARSARLVKHFDLDFPKAPQTEPYECYKHGRICTPTRTAAKFLHRYTRDSIRRVSQYQRIRSEVSAHVVHGDSREVDLPKGIDMVFTSPPYVGLIDYHD